MNHCTPDCFANEGQYKAGFAKNVLKDGWVHDLASPPEDVSRSVFYKSLEIAFSLPQREGRGEQNSLAFKEPCTETARYEHSCF